MIGLCNKYLWMEIKFIKGERALILNNFLVIADLHLGYEKIIQESGYTIPSLRKEFVKRINSIANKTGIKKLIILGDIKHNIPIASLNEKYEVPNFFRDLASFFEEIIVIKGNHDGKIEKMVHEKNVRIVKEYIHDNIAFIHGHSYPSNKAMHCELIVMGHVHPTFKIRDKSGILHNYPCWIIGTIKKTKLKKYKEINCRKIIVVPSFNKLTSGYEDLTGPLAKAIKKEEIFLLDLTKVK